MMVLVDLEHHLGSKFPNPQRLVRMFLRKEAEASSRIEQTYARVRTMLLFEHLPEVADLTPSVREVENNFRVLEEAFRIVRRRVLTLSDLRGLHAILFSAKLERNRREYYDCLLEVSRRGAWSEWIEFFSRAIADEADESVGKLDKLEQLRERYRDTLRSAGRGARLLALVDHLMGAPVVTAKQTAELFGVTPAAGQRMLEKLESLKIVREITGKPRYRIWLAHEYLAVFSPEDQRQGR